MDNFDAEQNFRLAQAIDWIDTIAEELFLVDDFSQSDKSSNRKESKPKKKRPLRKRGTGSLPV